MKKYYIKPTVSDVYSECLMWDGDNPPTPTPLGASQNRDPGNQDGATAKFDEFAWDDDFNGDDNWGYSGF